MKTKICTKCKIEKNIDDFNKRKNSRDGHDFFCSDCKSALKREYYAKNIEKERRKRQEYGAKHKIERAEYKKQYTEKNIKRIRLNREDYYYMKTHGITLKEKNQLIINQDYKCLSCGIDLRLLDHRRVCVDHSHKTGKIRGILCHNCNCCLGLLDEDINKIYRLAEYTTKYCIDK